MAKKKKDKGKKVKKGGGKQEEESEKGPTEKEILTQKCKDLQTRLEKLTVICETLEQERERCRASYETVVGDKDAICGYLIRASKEQLLLCRKLKIQIDGVIADCRPRKQALQDEMEKIATDFEGIKESLTKRKFALIGKLSLMEELRLSKDSLINKLENVESRVSKNIALYKEKLRDIDYAHIRARHDFHEECLEQIETAVGKFRDGALANLTHVVQDALKERYRAGEQLRKNADVWLELQDENARLRNRERFRNFELELDESLESHQSAIRCEQDREIERMVLECEAFNLSVSELDEDKATQDVDREDLWKRANDLRNEFSRIESKYEELNNAEKAGQEKFLQSLEESVNSLGKSNSRLRSVIAKAEQVFEEEVVTVLEENGVEPFFRNDLLRQFVNILKTNATLVSSSGGHQPMCPEWDRKYFRTDSGVESKRRDGGNKDVSTQTTAGLLTKYHKKKLFKCHFLPEK